MSEIYGYVRVSTQEQNEERQFLVRIEKNHACGWFWQHFRHSRKKYLSGFTGKKKNGK